MEFDKIWLSKESDVDKEFLSFCSSDRILAVLLKNRGIDTKESAQEFLNPLKQKLISPDVFTDMQKSVDRIKTAVEKKESIVVYGDFDADGVTSCAILYLTLKKIGANVSFYLPNRVSESHGLNTKALINLISKNRAKLIITVDCGISNVQEVKFANGFKTDVIITDHHEPSEILPDAFAILNPKVAKSLPDYLSIQELRSLSSLAGVGVAFKLCCKILDVFNCQDFVHEILPLVAIGTVGDVVELIGENRTLVAMGIELIKEGKNNGVQKILDSMSINDKKNITSENIAFGIVPRINAAGRLDSPLSALKVLISSPFDDVDDDIKNLNSLNSLRQTLCDEVFYQAVQMYEKDKSSHKKSIILFDENWHVGIIGIVASRLVETYNKPVFLMTRDVNSPDVIRCSCRSIDKINIFELLSLFKEKFIGFGGHKMAAGFSFDEKNIKFDVFRQELNIAIDETTQDVDFSKVNIYADMVVEPWEINEQVIENIKKMEPFGAANESPLFIMKNIILKNYKMMGQASNHLKIFAHKDGVDFECIKWNMPDFNLPLDSSLDILFYPQLNEFNGNKNIQYLISDIHSESFIKKNVSVEVNILDHRKKTDILNQVLDFVSSTKKSTFIYVENSKIKKLLDSSPETISLCFGLDNIPSECEQLMFFDVPSDKDAFIKIVKDTGAKIIHLMNFGINLFSVESLVMTLSGMLRYSLNNLDGKLDILKMAKSIGIDIDTVLTVFSIFTEIEMADIIQVSENEYKINSLKAVEMSKIKQSSLYTVIEDVISEINNFRDFYLNAEIDDIKAILV